MTVADRTVALLTKGAVITAADVAARLGVGEWVARKTLYRLAVRRRLVRVSYGKYALPGSWIAPKAARSESAR